MELKLVEVVASEEEASNIFPNQSITGKPILNNVWTQHDVSEKFLGKIGSTSGFQRTCSGFPLYFPYIFQNPE